MKSQILAESELCLTGAVSEKGLNPWGLNCQNTEWVYVLLITGQHAERVCPLLQNLDTDEHFRVLKESRYLTFL
jgi:hypothetical protein